MEERADFLAQLQDQHRDILSLRKRLGIAEKENEDLSKYQVNYFIFVLFLLLEKFCLVSEMMFNSIHFDFTQDEENDPHRARYSTAELKEILCERDELKAQINDLATELKIYNRRKSRKSKKSKRKPWKWIILSNLFLFFFFFVFSVRFLLNLVLFC